MSRTPFLFLVSAGFCALCSACGGDNLSLPDLTSPARLEAVSGTGQAGSIGTLLAEPLVVRVLDSEDHPVSNVKVTFTPGSGAAGSTVQPDTVESDGDGRASVRWALGTSAGGQTLVASVVGNSAVSASFTATAGAGQASRLEKVSGDNQTGIAGNQLQDSLVVRALDANGQPVAGVTVNWAATGGGNVSATSTVSRADGRAGIRRTLGPAAGQQATTATLADQADATVTFNSTAAVGTAGALRIEVQPAASAKSGEAFNRQPQLQLTDGNNNPVAQGGLAISARIGSGPSGATLIGSTTASTNSQGLAVFTNLGVSGPGGTYTLDFSGPEASGVTSDAIAVSAGDAVKLAMATQPPSSTQQGATLSPAPVVRLEDASGNGVAKSGVPVTVSLTGSGTLGGTLTVATDANGRATFADLAISNASGDCTLLFASDGLQSVASSTIQVASAPSGDRSTIDAPASVEAGVSATVRVTVRDKNGTALGGIAVTLSSSGGDNSISPASATTGGDGVATFSFSSTKAEPKSLSAQVSGLTIGPTSIEVAPSAGDASQTTANVPDGRGLRTTRITVQVEDSYGNRLVTGGDAVMGNVAGANSFVGTITGVDNQDGTYTLSYTPFLSGDDFITITLNGTPIKGSPYKSHVK
jgi:adhesin/invasin